MDRVVFDEKTAAAWLLDAYDTPRWVWILASLSRSIVEDNFLYDILDFLVLNGYENLTSGHDVRTIFSCDERTDAELLYQRAHQVLFDSQKHGCACWKSVWSGEPLDFGLKFETKWDKLTFVPTCECKTYMVPPPPASEKKRKPKTAARVARDSARAKAHRRAKRTGVFQAPMLSVDLKLVTDGKLTIPEGSQQFCEPIDDGKQYERSKCDVHFDYVIYAPPGCGKSFMNPKGIIPDTDYNGSWPYLPNICITNMPHLIAKAGAAFALLPSEPVFLARCKSKGCKPQASWYSDALKSVSVPWCNLVRSDEYLSTIPIEFPKPRVIGSLERKGRAP